MVLPFIANILGLLRKAGWPAFHPIFVQNALISDELHSITYQMSIIMAPGGIYCDISLILTALLYLGMEAKQIKL